MQAVYRFSSLELTSKFLNQEDELRGKMNAMDYQIAALAYLLYIWWGLCSSNVVQPSVQIQRGRGIPAQTATTSSCCHFRAGI